MPVSPEPFGAVLRRCRQSVALTQEGLAERAGLSANAIAALESGRRTSPRATTVRLLVEALPVDPALRARLMAAGVPGPQRDGVPPVAVRPGPGGDPAPARYGFVGRDRELRRLLDAWQRRVRLVLVSGEAGAGKTRLVGELAALAAPGATVLWGRCTPDRLGAYEPLLEPVRTALPLARLDDRDVAELARLVPEVADTPLVQPPSTGDPGMERRLLFEAVARLLGGLGPALLVLDDLHWADAASLSLVSHLATGRELADVVIVGTVRSTDQDAANAAALAAVRRRASMERLQLGGLSAAEIGTLVREIAAGRAGADLVDTVCAATDGNPLYVEELTEHLLEHAWQPGPRSGRAGVPVPVGVRDTIGQRTAMLSAEAQALLRAGAVLGRRFDVDLAGRLVRLADGALVAAVEDALLSGLVTEESAQWMCFSHALVQSAVYEAGSARRRLQLHRDAAIALEQHALVGPLPDAQVYDLARHWAVVAAGDPDAAPRAARWARRAGDAAAAAADLDEAIARYEAAAMLWQASTVEHAETLIQLGAALSALGERARAEDRFRAALGLADALGDVLLFARAAIGLSANVQYGRSEADKIAALERAIAELPPSEDVLIVTAAAMLKRQLGFDDSQDAYERRQRAAAIVLDAVSSPDLDRPMLLSLSASRDAIVVDDPVLLERLSRRMVATAEQERNLLVLANARYGQAWAALELADGATWSTAVSAFRAVADQLGLAFERALAATMASTGALIAGRYAEAAVQAQQAFEFSVGIDPNAAAIRMTHQVLSGIDLGRAAGMVELMAAARDELAPVPTFLGGLAMTAAMGGATELATEILDTQARVGFDAVRKDLEWLPVMGFLSHACVLLGRRDHAGELYHRLSGHPARAIRVGPLSGFWGPTDFHLGALCRLLGRHDEARLRLRRAIEVCTGLGALPWGGRCRLELAELLDRTGSGPDRREAEALRAAAVATARELGAPGLTAVITG